MFVYKFYIDNIGNRAIVFHITQLKIITLLNDVSHFVE